MSSAPYLNPENAFLRFVLFPEEHLGPDTGCPNLASALHTMNHQPDSLLELIQSIPLLQARPYSAETISKRYKRKLHLFM